MKENHVPNRPAISAELFTTLFEVEKDAPSSQPQAAPDGSIGVIDVIDVVDIVDIVDLTTSLPPANEERQQEDPSSAPSPCPTASDFCSRCLVSLTSLNFLAKMSHVKTCGGRVIDGQRAVARFLSYYGYDGLQTAFEEKGIDMDFLFVADAKSIEKITAIHGLGGRAKFSLALEQYKKSGRLHVRNSLVGEQREEKRRKQLPERNERSSTWARSKAVVSDPGDHKLPAQRPRKHPDALASSPLDKVLLESLWIRPNDTKKRRINLTSCSTLWVAAGVCQSNHAGIEERLRARRRGKEEVQSINSTVSTSASGRGTAEQMHVTGKPEQGRVAMKRARLQAAQAELAIAEQSVRRLKAEIDELQCEIQKEHGV